MLPARILRGGCRGLVITAAALVLIVPSALSRPVRSCGAGDLRATYTFVPFSVGLGHVSYVLTVTNRSRSACVLTAPLPMTLLDRHRHPLPTAAQWSPSAPYRVTVSPRQWAQVQSRFSPDVPGPGEPQTPPCEPTASFLRLTVGHGQLLGPMDPVPVCEHGAMAFGRLQAVAATPSCSASSLLASFKRTSPPSGGSVDYALTLHNRGTRACHTSSTLGLRLLTAAGTPLPTHVLSGIPSPFVITPHTKELALATLSTRAGPGEPSHGPCEPLASRIRIIPRPGRGTTSVPIQPPLRACHSGKILFTGLAPSG